MKKAILFLIAIFSFAIINAQENPQRDVIVDFTGYPVGNIVTFTDSKGKVDVFNSANGLIQTRKLKEDFHTIVWTISPQLPSTCQALFYYLPGLEAILSEVAGEPKTVTLSGVPVGVAIGGYEYFSFSTICR